MKGVCVMKELSLRIFGTEDYESILAILPPYDGMVSKFHKEAAKLESEGSRL